MAHWMAASVDRCAVFVFTDWDMFTTATPDELTEAVTSYSSGLVYRESYIPTRTRVSYNNDKPWFTAKIRRLSFRNGDRADRSRFKES